MSIVNYLVTTSEGLRKSAQQAQKSPFSSDALMQPIERFTQGKLQELRQMLQQNPELAARAQQLLQQNPQLAQLAPGITQIIGTPQAQPNSAMPNQPQFTPTNRQGRQQNWQGRPLQRKQGIFDFLKSKTDRTLAESNKAHAIPIRLGDQTIDLQREGVPNTTERIMQYITKQTNVPATYPELAKDIIFKAQRQISPEDPYWEEKANLLHTLSEHVQQKSHEAMSQAMRDLPFYLTRNKVVTLRPGEVEQAAKQIFDYMLRQENQNPQHLYSRLMVPIDIEREYLQQNPKRLHRDTHSKMLDELQQHLDRMFRVQFGDEAVLPKQQGKTKKGSRRKLVTLKTAAPPSQQERIVSQFQQWASQDASQQPQVQPQQASQSTTGQQPQQTSLLRTLGRVAGNVVSSQAAPILKYIAKQDSGNQIQSTAATARPQAASIPSAAVTSAQSQTASTPQDQSAAPASTQSTPPTNTGQQPILLFTTPDKLMQADAPRQVTRFLKEQAPGDRARQLQLLDDLIKHQRTYFNNQNLSGQDRWYVEQHLGALRELVQEDLNQSSPSPTPTAVPATQQPQTQKPQAQRSVGAPQPAGQTPAPTPGTPPAAGTSPAPAGQAPTTTTGAPPQTGTPQPGQQGAQPAAAPEKPQPLPAAPVQLSEEEQARFNAIIKRPPDRVVDRLDQELPAVRFAVKDTVVKSNDPEYQAVKKRILQSVQINISDPDAESKAPLLIGRHNLQAHAQGLAQHFLKQTKGNPLAAIRALDSVLKAKSEEFQAGKESGMTEAEVQEGRKLMQDVRRQAITNILRDPAHREALGQWYDMTKQAIEGNVDDDLTRASVATAKELYTVLNGLEPTQQGSALVRWRDRAALLLAGYKERKEGKKPDFGQLAKDVKDTNKVNAILQDKTVQELSLDTIPEGDEPIVKMLQGMYNVDTELASDWLGDYSGAPAQQQQPQQQSGGIMDYVEQYGPPAIGGAVLGALLFGALGNKENMLGNIILGLLFGGITGAIGFPFLQKLLQGLFGQEAAPQNQSNQPNQGQQK